MTPLLSIHGLGKVFGAVHALKDVSLEVHTNEVVGLIGENGAGKSSLLKILSGVYQPDVGQIRKNGITLSLRSPLHAEEAGIGMVHQEQSLLMNISVAENLYLGREKQFVRFGKISWRRMHTAARRQLAKVNLFINPAVRTETLSFAQRQMVELAKALILEESFPNGVVILLDEPTSVLEAKEVDLLFERIRALRSRVSFVFISHRLDEVLKVSDRVYVLRDGQLVGQLAQAEATLPKIHSLMVGRSLEDDYYGETKRAPLRSNIALSVKGLTRAGQFQDVSFELHEGEILGLCGVIGSGREDVLRSLAGLSRPQSGEVQIQGRALKLSSPGNTVSQGIAFIPQERRTEGLVMSLPVVDNMALPSLRRCRDFGLVSYKKQRAIAENWISRLSIRPPNARLPASSLSGGNQQKVVLAKWIEFGARVLLLDHPTRGVDVGAKQEIYALIRELAGKGIAIVLTADSLEETIGLCDTILVMKDHKISTRISARDQKPSQVAIIEAMV